MCSKSARLVAPVLQLMISRHVETTAFVCSVDLFTPAVTTATGAQQRTKCTHVSPAPKSRSVDGRAEKRAKSHALRNLFGNLNVTAIRIAAPEGGMGMWFIFSVSCPSAKLGLTC